MCEPCISVYFNDRDEFNYFFLSYIVQNAISITYQLTDNFRRTVPICPVVNEHASNQKNDLFRCALFYCAPYVNLLQIFSGVIFFGVLFWHRSRWNNFSEIVGKSATIRIPTLSVFWTPLYLNFLPCWNFTEP